MYLCVWFDLHSRELLFTFETAGAQWLRCCATNRKVAGSIPAGVNGFFIDIKSFRSHYGSGVDLPSNRNEYQEYFLGVKKRTVLKGMLIINLKFIGPCIILIVE